MNGTPLAGGWDSDGASTSEHWLEANLIMIYSPRRKFCFIHIPKTAGTSITDDYCRNMVFSDVVLDPRQVPRQYESFVETRYGLHKHSGAASISKVVGEEEFRSLLTVAVVRDPVDWVFSAWKWTKKVKESTARIKKVSDESASFEDFFRKISTFFPSQSSFLKVNGDMAVRRVIRFDRLEPEWRDVCEMIGIDSQLQKRNVSGEFSEELPSRLKEEIRSCYAEDCTLFERIN